MPELFPEFLASSWIYPLASAIQHWSQSLPDLSPYYLRHRGARFGGREQLALINAQEIHPACDRDSVPKPSSHPAFRAEFARNGCESQDGIYNGLVSHSRKLTGGTYRHCNISSVVDLTSTELSSHALMTNVTACLCKNRLKRSGCTQIKDVPRWFWRYCPQVR